MLATDLRYAVRALWKRPGFSFFAVGVLAAGVGAATAIFSYADAILFKPIEIPGADRTVTVTQLTRTEGIEPVTTGQFREWQSRSVFSEMSGWSHGAGAFNLTGSGFAERVRGLHVTPSHFSFFGARLAAGRSFGSDEDDVAVVTQRFLRQRFESASAALGQKLVLNQKPYTVIGVLSGEGPLGRDSTDVYLPMNQSAFTVVYGKLNPGVSIEHAAAALASPPLSVQLIPFRDVAIGATHRRTAWILLGAVALLLITACANVGNLLLAQIERRRREAATRLALGATRGRLVRQFLTESLSLSALGAAGGVLVAQWLVQLLPLVTPPGMVPSDVSVDLDWRVLAFSIALALLTGLAAGLMPALRVSSRRPADPRDRFRSALLIAEVALTFILVTGAGLLLRSFNNLMSVEAGFERRSLITFKTEFDAARYPSASSIREFQSTVLDRLHTTPLVTAAGYTTALPLGGLETQTIFAVDGVAERFVSVAVALVSEEYASAVGTRLLRGSPLSAKGVGDRPAVLVNQAFVRKYLAGLEPIGRSLSSMMFKRAPMTIAGVVADVRGRTLDRNPEPQVYVLATSLPMDALVTGPRQFHFVVKTAADPASQVPAVRAAVASVDKAQPLFDVRTMEEVVGRSVAGPRFRAVLFGWFGVLALLISAAGVFGVLHSLVAQRTHEIGIRMALGAGAGELVHWVVRRGMSRVAAGVGLGVAGSLAATRVLESYLFGVKPYDAAAFVVTAAVLALAGLAACWIPARRAARVDPMVALRIE